MAKRKAVPTDAQAKWLNFVHANNGTFRIPVECREEYVEHQDCINHDWITKNPGGGYRLTGWGISALVRYDLSRENK
jgi:hypothetical protein